MNKELKYGGYTARPSDYECQDGDLATSINLLNEDGNITPILQPKEEMTMPEDGKYKIVYIHETASFKHYILLDSDTGKLHWRDANGYGSGTEIGYASGFNHCNSVGNTLIAIGSYGIDYFLWGDNKYTALGDRLPNIDVSFGLVGHPRLYSRSGGEKFVVKFAEKISNGNQYNDYSDANKTTITEQVMAKVNKFIREQTIDKGRFCFPFFVRYALRLFDGSLVCHSAPILMNPTTKAAPIAFVGGWRGSGGFEEAYDCDVFMVAANLDYQVSHSGEYHKLDKWKDIVKSIDVFISRPIYTYDQNGKIDNSRDSDNFDSVFIGKLYHDKYHRGGAVNFPTTITNDCILGPIDLSGGASGGTSEFLKHYMEWDYKQIYALYFSANRSIPGYTFHFEEYSDKKDIENLENCSTFYLLHSIKLEDAKATTRQNVPIEDDYLQSLTSREVMTDDYQTHDRLLPTSSQVHNSRLNLSGVRRELFSGFNPAYLFAYCDNSLSVWKKKDNSNEFIIRAPSVFYGDTNLEIEIYIKEGGKTMSVSQRADTMTCATWGSAMQYPTATDLENKTNGKREKKSWGTYFFYPNVNACKVVVRSSEGGEEGSGVYGSTPGCMVYDLKPHDFLNGAFCFIGYNTVRTVNYTSGSVPEISEPWSSSSIVDCGNKVYTSEVNNPFFFPLLGINTVGTGKILGISTAAKALSEGQFGQFPLYAFTEDGVWAMELSPTGTYSAKQPITRDVCINAQGITQIDSAVLFPTDRGIMLIQGSQTECISEAINSQAPFDLTKLPHLDKLHAMLGHSADTCLPVVPFLTYIRDCRMIYDYVHQRIIVYNKSYTYAYVWSLKTKLWGMMFSRITDNVNSYPEALAVTSDGKMVNFAKTDGQPVKGLLVTRPLKLEAPDIIKTINTVIQRGNFMRGHVQSVLYGSRDLIHWHMVWTSKDHILRGFRGTGYKYFRIALVCGLDEGEGVYGASIDFNPRQTNQLR